jgi:hypothetical protein
MQPALNVHGNAQGHVGALQKTFALGRVSMDRCGDVRESRAHLKAKLKPADHSAVPAPTP